MPSIHSESSTLPADLSSAEAAESTAAPVADSLQAPLLGQSLDQLTAWVQQQGQPAYRGKQLYQWLYQRGARSLSEVTVFPKAWRAEVADYPIGRSHVHYRATAPDGTVKFLLRLADGHIIETVGMPTYASPLDPPKSPRLHAASLETRETSEPSVSPLLSRLTVCVSSQVGCPMACDFCATGKGGFLRNLAAHEIIDQVLTVQEDFGQRVSNIVFMGMGEPLLNTDNVLAAVRSLNTDVGISQRTMTVSTVGIPGHIRRLAQHKLQVTLAVSLHASNQATREALIPSARHYPLEALLDECRDYVQHTGRRVTFEYILLAGLNDEPEHAEELAHHLRGFQSHVNLIPYNPISEVDYQRPDERRIKAFVRSLQDHHIAVSVRYSRGLEADAACGQLRARRG
ncbi:23S rRNA (adenine(2503)-C(2))-methyltransferase RlmN [Thermoleptolyngbya oregonensis NK1-22]|uniref:Probable dual-specificity RNA methyltransferase RlmN n=1 Tax=Thermoleptolyngbya oregonensis NK1-22 TaxID=2547457 RepID=A0AA97BP02_9CYAN|nr:23S rRNA (adenine(2503)-C(2))-methyltransferase RlmN [Thermoleptolyngbya oregonensis]WOB42418.1 23S rRNA (adenine(2503)-C(2))-methyltransferase RlmN [Thermoleptolyngbya oregonensis NK1-22]